MCATSVQRQHNAGIGGVVEPGVAGQIVLIGQSGDVVPVPEIKATLYRMEHEKTGAELVWLDRADDNKTFAIAFKTIPQDRGGCPH